MKYLRIVTYLTLTLTLFGCVSPPQEDSKTSTAQVQSELAEIKNSDVTWDGNYVGVRASLGGASVALRLLAEAQPKVFTAGLIDALRDKDRYVAAHVLLCIISGQGPQGGSEGLNGLKVDLYADNVKTWADYPPGQQPGLIEKWTLWQLKQRT